MRSHELLPAPETAAGRLVVLDAGEAAAKLELDAEGWSRVDPSALSPDDRCVVVAAAGDDGAVADVLPVLRGASPTAVLVLLTAPLADTAVERAAVAVAVHGWEVTRTAPLDDEPWRTGVLLAPAPDELAEGRTELARRARSAVRDRRAVSEGETDRSLDALRRRLHAAESARASEFTRAASLERDLERTRDELTRERERREELERSTSYRLGEAVVQSIRDPRQVPRRSRELLDRWRKRGQGGGISRSDRGGQPARLEPARRSPIVTTVPSLAAPQRRDAVAGVVTDRTAQALEDDVLLTRLLPFDAVELIAITSPQVVLIESEACTAGQPWAGGGTGAVPARDRELAAIVDAADRVGAASVLVWSGPRWRAPGLAAIAERCTLEVAGDGGGFPWVLGPPPHRVHASAPADRGGLALFDPRGEVRPPRLDGDLTTLGGELGGPAVTDPWATWSRHDAWLVPASGADRWQVAAAATAAATPIVRDTAAVPEWARAYGAVPLAELGEASRPAWSQRRRAILDGGCVATLRTLAELLGRDLVPATARSVALHLAATDDAHVDAVLALDHLPAGSVAVAPPGLSDRAVAALEGVGLRVREQAPADTRFDVALDASRHGPGHLADLLAGWELTRTPVVAAGAVDDVRTGTVADADTRDRLVERDAVRTGEPDAPATLVPAREVQP